MQPAARAGGHDGCRGSELLTRPERPGKVIQPESRGGCVDDLRSETEDGCRRSDVAQPDSHGGCVQDGCRRRELLTCPLCPGRAVQPHSNGGFDGCSVADVATPCAVARVEERSVKEGSTEMWHDGAAELADEVRRSVRLLICTYSTVDAQLAASAAAQPHAVELAVERQADLAARELLIGAVLASSLLALAVSVHEEADGVHGVQAALLQASKKIVASGKSGRAWADMEVATEPAAEHDATDTTHELPAAGSEQRVEKPNNRAASSAGDGPRWQRKRSKKVTGGTASPRHSRSSMALPP
eukprot:TRINITY_DN55458_c0_g1_i1.p1 TRINITY_DN55458_c0_g1~~TRINITY_DN55458_c0_g1_i1.p1  ORF type:complete len:300 (+),score=45.20 TRINITY_DN55458_c0_g1_i1:246-1145(+)